MIAWVQAFVLALSVMGDAWKKAFLYLALLGATVYGPRIYREYLDELDGPA